MTFFTKQKGSPSTNWPIEQLQSENPLKKINIYLFGALSIFVSTWAQSLAPGTKWEEDECLQIFMQIIAFQNKLSMVPLFLVNDINEPKDDTLNEISVFGVLWVGHCCSKR